jgi:hypothetical protein
MHQIPIPATLRADFAAVVAEPYNPDHGRDHDREALIAAGESGVWTREAFRAALRSRGCGGGWINDDLPDMADQRDDRATVRAWRAFARKLEAAAASAGLSLDY